MARPGENLIWSIAGLVIFGGYTILDFNRLRRAGQSLAVPRSRRASSWTW
jgi:FtsH-binding integral membrane protein